MLRTIQFYCRIVRLAFASLFFLNTAHAVEPGKEILLWPNGAPGSEDNPTLPAFQALICPGHSQRIEPATNSPPVFGVCGYNDQADVSEGLASVYLKFKQLKVPAELHIYAGNGHGFGLRMKRHQTAGNWIERFEEWLYAA